ncbi:MAG TPA: serine/threonine-protein kinase [Gemmatimonadales bacterium]|nr:serine/threonine-protein kinase [Gemmatimonadales bacterium]
MTEPTGETFLRRRERTIALGGPLWASLGSGALPADLLTESVRRLRAVALLYSAAYAMATLLPLPFCEPCAADFFGTAREYLPPFLSIAMALVMYGIARSRHLAPRTVLHIGLVFQVLGAIGIASSEYQDIVSGIDYVPTAGFEDTPETGGVGLSWVSVWVLLFTIVVPTQPGRALVAAACSAAAVPGVAYTFSRLGLNQLRLDFFHYFFGFIFPYVIIVFMAYVASRVVFGLGRKVSEARDLGSYRLIERLGSGGMGEVWRAEHRLLARPAAVKLIRPDAFGHGSPDQRHVMLQRFEREARATATMRCPHTVELYDFGVAEDGTFYYVMELLDGFDLDTLVTRFGPVQAPRAVHFLRQVCHSLGEAHERGLIHRDIKPANVYVCRLGREADWIKVLDFGMVKTRRDGGAADVKLTAENVVGGTPAFMAPEQVLGESPIDGRTDIYATGCLAYWLLTGQLVFQGKTPLETMVQHVQAKPVPPSKRSELEIPPALEETVLACLAKDPDRRPQTADELSERLRAALSDPGWTREQAARWWDRHRPQGSLAPAHA